MIAVITGASSGIGRDMSLEFAKHGYNLVVAARSKDKLESLKKEIIEKYKTKVDVKIVDISNKDECINFHNEVIKEYSKIDVLINNAGFGDFGYFTETDLNKELDMINTNIVGLHILTKLFLKDMVKENHGYILNVSSIAGFMPGPLMATYYSTKSYVLRLTQSLRTELFMKHSKVKIGALCPGPVKTNFNNVANVKFNIIGQSSKYVAKYAYYGIKLKKNLMFPSFIIWLYRLIVKIIPDQWSSFINFFMQRRKRRK